MSWPGNLFFKRIALFLISLSLCLVALEIFLRVVSPPSPWSPRLPLQPKNRIELHVNLKGVTPVAIHSTNSLGLRGDEPPANWNQSYTIVTIGGSTTQCFFLDDHKTWPYLLGQNLRDRYENVWVGNGGLDGQTTRAHIIFMEEVISRLRPKAVVLLVGANDLGLSLREDRRLRGNGFDAGRPIWYIRLFGRSRLFQILFLWKQALVDDVKVVNKSGDGDQTFKPLPQGTEQLPADLGTLLPTLNEYRQNIERIIQLGRSDNVRVVFLTQPLLYEDTEYWKGIEGNFYWINQTKGRLSAATYWKLLDIYNKTLLETCAKEKVECFDLASAIPHDGNYFYDNGHFNERGATLVAEQVAGFLKQSRDRDQVPLVAGH
jgi:lysophospholipase L1-like esterase